MGDKRECLVCNKEIKLEYECPCNAVVFSTSGNYGSSVYDIAPEIITYLCDDCFCLKARQQKFYKIDKNVVYTTTVFDYDHYDN